MERPNADMRLIINMASSVREGERTYAILKKACHEFLKVDVELGGIIRRDLHVRESIRKQTSLMTRFPNSEAATDIQAIVSRLQTGS